MSLRSLRDKVADVTCVSVSKELLRVAIKRQGLSKKKAKFFGTSIAQVDKTTSFLQRRADMIAKGRHFFSIDETSFGRHSAPTYGYSAKGTPLVIQRNMSRVQKTQTAICCVSSHDIIATDVFCGSANTTSFCEFIDGICFPEGSVVLLDNVAFHHASAVKRLCTEKGIELLYVPPYSPWFNPIEMAFSIVKREFYKSSNIDRSFASLTSTHLSSFFRKSLNCIGPF